MNNIEKYKLIEEKIFETRKNNFESLSTLNTIFRPLILNLSKKINDFDAYENLQSKLDEIIIFMPIEETSKNHTTLTYINIAMKRYAWNYIDKLRENKDLINQMISSYETNTTFNKNIFKDILEILPPYEKEIFKLRYIDDLTLKDIGEIENKSIQSIFKTLKKIKAYLNTSKVKNELLV